MKLAFGAFVVVMSLYLGVMFVPVYYSNYEFDDALKNEALFSTNSNATEEKIRDNVFKRAQQLEIPITKENIKVHRVGTIGSGSVTIEAPYTVHVDLIAYPVDVSFSPAATNKGLF